ncbi:hypothetical protein [Embleya sp. NBC_00896]|uniref:hypothetical protein n=1 Tax=Embleya sp. NBC_00896 TaxID=2975961 RepID=UPI002F91023E|nr:hypothetical protein OG928_40770 [Embleya sp. NBC_00896]
MHRKRNRKLAEVAVCAGLALGAVGLSAAPALADGRPAERTAAAETALPTFDFSDCPELPANADPDKWRCEVMIATGDIRLGGLTVPIRTPMTITHSEGPLPDGTTGQVFGAMHAAPSPAAGGLLNIPGLPERAPLLGVNVETRYGGWFDFISHGTSAGGLDVTFALSGPLLPKGCTIGTAERPVRLTMMRKGSNEWVSKDPPILKGTIWDTTLTVPAATDCGPLGPVLNHRNGLPAPTGASAVTFDGQYTFKTYTQLHPTPPK